MRSPSSIPSEVDTGTIELNRGSVSTARGAVPAPWGIGELPVSARWISPIYGQRNVKRASGGGKGGKGGGAGTDVYYGTIAGLVHQGQVEELTSIQNSGKVIWGESALRTTSANPLVLDITGGGTIRFYWGTDSQPVNDLLNTYESHPPYAGACYFVLEDYCFGEKGEQQPPNLQFFVRTKADQNVITGGASAFDGYFSANPVTCAAGILQSYYFCNLPSSALYGTSFQAAADLRQAETLNGDADKIRSAVAPFIEQATDAQTILGKLSLVADCDFRFRPTDGKIEVVAHPRNASVSATYPTFGWFDETEIPKLSSDDFDKAPNSYLVEFRDSSALHRDDAVEREDQARVNKPGAVRNSERVSMKEILHTREAAQALAADLVSRKSQPGMTRPITLRPKKARRVDGSPLDVSDYFAAPITQDPQSGTVEVGVFVVESIELEPFGPVRIEASRVIDIPILPTTNISPEPNQVSTAMPPVVSQRIVSLPPVTDGEDASIVPLVCRPHNMAGDCVVSYSDTSTGDYQELGETPFALPVKLQAAFDSSATTLRVGVRAAESNGTRYDRELHLVTEWSGGELEGRDNQLLIVLLKKASGEIAVIPGSNRDFVEVLSVRGVASIVSSGVYDIPVLRARLGTSALDFSAGTFPDAWSTYEAWVIPRSLMTRLDHADFEQLIGTDDEAFFRFRTRSPNGSYEPALAYEERLRLNDAALPLLEYGSQPDATTIAPTAAFTFPYTFVPGQPDAPTLYAATVGQGQSVGLRWSNIPDFIVNEYRIFRATGPAFSDETMIATDSDESHTDYGVTLGTQYRYRVKAESIDNDATDSGVSAFSNAVFATPSGVGDLTTPPNPTPMNLVGSGLRTVADGSVRAYLNFNLPALSGNGVSQSVIYSLGSTPLAQGGIAHQKENSGAVFIQIDDLEPNVAVNVGSVQYSSGGAVSGITVATGSPFTTPSKTSRPAAPASVVTTMPTSGDGFPPSTNSLSNIANGTWVETPTTSDPTVVMCEMWWAFDAPVDNAAYTEAKRWPITLSRFAFTMYFPSPSGFIWVRFVDKFGNYSAWTRTPGVANFGSGHAGNIISENKSDTKLTGVTISQGSGGRRQKVVYPVNDVYSNASAGVEVAVNIPVGGFMFKPDSASAPNLSSAGGYSARYDWDNAGNSATNAVVMIRRHDGATIGAGTGFRITCDFVGY